MSVANFRTADRRASSVSRRQRARALEVSASARIQRSFISANSVSSLAMRAVAACMICSGESAALAFAASGMGSDGVVASWGCGSVLMSAQLGVRRGGNKSGMRTVRVREGKWRGRASVCAVAGAADDYTFACSERKEFALELSFDANLSVKYMNILMTC
jgi:hypothetical protein